MGGRAGWAVGVAMVLACAGAPPNLPELTATTSGSTGGSTGVASASSGSTTGSPAGDGTSSSGTDSEGSGMTGAPMAYPQTCGEIRGLQPDAPDGPYVLYVGAEPVQPWTVQCRDMATDPAEFLPLPAGAADNFSQYTAGGASPGENVRTEYALVRIDPITLEVDLNDETFATSTGQLTHREVDVTSMPYAVAMSCDNSPSGLARIDLTGTPFAVGEDFCVNGFLASGTFRARDPQMQVIDLEGGGNCGWIAPLACSRVNPFNAMVDASLQLSYLP